MSEQETNVPADLAPPAGAVSVVERLILLLDAESAQIEVGQTEKLSDTTLDKSRMLLEINRLITGQFDSTRAGSDSSVITREDFDRLKNALSRNERALSAQLAAARGVSDIITNALRDQQSDTTYANRPAQRAQSSQYGRAF